VAVEKHAQFIAAIVDLVVKHGVRAVSYSRSPDKATVKKLKDAGVVCMPTVGAVKHALKAVEMGADVVTVQGGEGGGHTGSVPTTLLLPEVVRRVKVPVVGAGGFMDGRGRVAAMAFGASGIAMGTRFLMTAESPVPSATKERYVACGNPADIIISRAIDGMPQRMVMNEMLGQLERAGTLRKLLLAISSGLAYSKYTGAILFSLLQSGLRMRIAVNISGVQFHRADIVAQVAAALDESGLDPQLLHFATKGIALNARRACVNHVSDAGHRERGFGHVGGQHDAPAGVAIKDAVLLGLRQA
jgi:NAD(P)H-dependent flavin oxidoreductase YrpB (nitropropane dioxygenase family)